MHPAGRLFHSPVSRGAQRRAERGQALGLDHRQPARRRPAATPSPTTAGPTIGKGSSEDRKRRVSTGRRLGHVRLANLRHRCPARRTDRPRPGARRSDFQVTELLAPGGGGPLQIAALVVPAAMGYLGRQFLVGLYTRDTEIMVGPQLLTAPASTTVTRTLHRISEVVTATP